MVIATVFLTIIGMTGGFVLGERRRGEIAAENQQQQTPEPSPIVTDLGPSCPPEAVAKAEELRGITELYQVLKVQTDNGTTVWICQDGGEKLYYQGKTGGLDVPLVQNKNGLFLSNVLPQGEDDYLAVADNGNRILVSRKRVEIRFTSGRTQTNKVVSVE